MGLGDMAVNSYLDQPFNAEIELIDVGGVPLSGIKASLASAEDFDRVGIERIYALNLLTFNVEKNANGHVVIKVRSIERISEPFMPLLVDLAWANGQVYRSYTILLDPPNYKLGQVKRQLQNIVKRQNESQLSPEQTGVINKPVYGEVERVSTTPVIDNRGAATYGPTIANETVWQIAQRYKTENILLQQMILAIVGTNPHAFIEGNLNGLKAGSHLRIPTNSTASRVPVTLAKLEVLAHDKAWQSRQAIEHALLPPYIDSNAPTAANESEMTALGYPLSVSKIPVILDVFKSTSKDEPMASRLLPLASSLLSFGEDVAPQHDQDKLAVTPQANIKTETSIATAAIDSVREVNALLSEQLRLLQADNKRLQQQLAKRDQDLTQLRKRIFAIVERQRIAGQVGALPATEHSSVWTWAIFLLALGAGGFMYWSLWIKPSREKKTVAPVSGNSPPLEPIVPSVFENKPVVMSEPVEISPKELDVPAILPVEDDKEHTEILPEGRVADNHVIAFEPTLQQEAKETPIENAEPELVIVPEPVEEKEDKHSIDFVLNPVEPAPPVDAAKPMKSKAALDTLLALAKTYVDMGDAETAKESLQEVIDFGSEEQKLDATRLLDMLDKKND